MNISNEIGVTMGLWSGFVELIGMIPGTFWGVVAGSLFALGGVILSNRASDRRLQLQYDHERDLRIRDSELVLRKDVYLATTEANFAGLMLIAKMADLETPTNKITEGYAEKAASVAKVQVIGNPDTIEAMSDVSNELTAVMMTLSVKRLALIAKKQRLTLLQEQIASSSKESDRWLELMKQYNLAGTVDERLWQTIEVNLDNEHNQIAELIEQQEKLVMELLAEQLALTKECVAEAARLSELAVPAVIAFRNELDLPLDEDRYKRIVEEANAKLMANTSQFIDETHSQVRAEIAAAQNDDDEAPTA